MAATDRRDAGAADAESAATTALESATLAHLIAVADGDCLVAAGLLAGGCDAVGLPYHVGVAGTRAELDARLEVADGDATSVVIGVEADADVVLDPDGPVSPLAYRVATGLGAEASPASALAGVVAAGGAPSRAAPGLVDAAGLERRPGVAVPTDDLADGLAHTGLAHAGFSGDPEAAQAALDELGLVDVLAGALGEADARRVASLLVLATCGAPGATPRAATAVARALRPHRTDGELASVEATGDAVSALAEQAPGLAVGLALGQADVETVLEVWRAHGRAAHAGVREADTARYDGVLVARTDGPVAAVARLLRDFRSPEPTVLALGDGEAAAASVDDPVGTALTAAAEAAGGDALARGRTGAAAYDPDREETFAETFREAR